MASIGSPDRSEPPGRPGGAARTLATDPRSDPRMVAAMAPFGLDQPPDEPPVGADSPLTERLAFCSEVEAGFQAVFGALADGVPQPSGVTTELVVIRGADENEIALSIHRPDHLTASAPCVVHLHGGGMGVLAAADPIFVRWREGLAATGLVVVGVEFRNSSGKLGPHPFPAGLEDCASAVRWAAAHRGDLGASGVMVSGESGGGNLALAVAIKAKREGWLDEIAGVYAQCPNISNAYVDPPTDLASLRECDGYFVSCALFSVLASVYDPDSQHPDDPACWPLRANPADLAGLPPHVISVNELDPLRDEGLAYHRMLVEAGVTASARTIPRTCHGAEVLLGAALPEVRAASLEDVAEFARSVASRQQFE